MNQQKLVLANFLMILILANVNNLMVEGVFAGAGRYGYGRRETKLHSKEIICKRIKGLCDEIKMEKSKRTERAERMTIRLMRDYIRAADMLVKLRERLREVQKNTI